MEPEWLSYVEVAHRLGITLGGARSRAKRLGWPRQMDNGGRVLVLVALEPRRPGNDLQARARQFLEHKLANGPVAAGEIDELKSRFSPRAVEAAVSDLGLIGVRLSNGKGPHLATRVQAAELGVDAR